MRARVARPLFGRFALLLAGTAVLAGCEGTFTGDLASEPPGDPDVTQVNTTLLGLEFEKANGNTETLEFRNGEPVDLMDLTDGAPMRLFTEEPLSSGDYTGVRLLFESDADVTVVDAAGGEFNGQLAEGQFADLNFTVADDERSQESFALALDLRRSLVFDDTTDAYTLTPVLRAVRSDKAADVGGSVNVDCPSDTTLTEGGAVYAFAGTDVVPDDLDGIGVEPIATALVRADSSSATPQYSLRFLPPGQYTLAVTCLGASDDLAADDALEFQRITNVSLDDGESADLDLD